MNSRYDEVADWYDDVIRNGTIVHEGAIAALFEFAGDTNGLRVCDLACGQGVVSRAIANRGGRVYGIDISQRLLDIAMELERKKNLGITYKLMAAENLEGLNSDSFDLVVCNMALMDIDDLESTVREIKRILIPSGRFCFTIMHPCFQTSLTSWSNLDGGTGRLVRRYFKEGRWNSSSTGMRQRVGSVHRTLESYINTLSQVGLQLTAIREPFIDREPGKSEPAYDEVPAIFAACFTKP